MIRRLLRRVACRAGRHHPIACAGRQDHTWTWNTGRDQWVATLGPTPPLRVVPTLPRPTRHPDTRSHRADR